MLSIITLYLIQQGASQTNSEVTAEAANTETESMETETSPENQEPAADVTKMDTNEAETQEGEKAAATQPSQPKQIVKAVDLQVESKTSSFTQQKIQELTEREVSCFIIIIFRWKITRDFV